MKIRKLLAVFLCVSLAACGKNTAEEPLSEEISSTITKFSGTEEKADITEQAETEEAYDDDTPSPDMTSQDEVQSFRNDNIVSANFKYSPPDREFLKNCFGEGKSTVNIALDSSGNWAECGDELYTLMDNIEAVAALKRERYDEFSDAMQDDPISYEEYRKRVLDYYGLPADFDENTSGAGEKAYFKIRGYVSEDDTAPYTAEEIFLRAAEYGLSKPANEMRLAGDIGAKLASGGFYQARISYYYDGNNILSVRSDYEGPSFDYNDRISVTGEDGIILGNAFVPSGTKTLCISSREEDMIDYLADYLPEDCVIASSPSDGYGSSERAVFDIAEIAEKLPELKKLYIHQAVLENEEQLITMTGLETLSYWHSEYTSSGYIETLNDMPFIGMNQLKELRLYANYDRYDFLTDMTKLTSVYIETNCGSEGKMKQLFSCPKITELKLSGAGSINGIQKLKGLKKLTLEYASGTDLSYLAKLPALEYLSVRADGKVDNLSSIAEIKGLKELSLDCFEKMTAEDWSFLENAKDLEYLRISYSSGTSSGALGKMTWLKSLSLIDMNKKYDFSFIKNMKSLENLFVFGYGSFGENNLDITGISELKKLRSAAFWLCSFSDLSELKDCKAMESLDIYNNTAPFDCKWLEGMDLKELSISDGSSFGVKNMETIGTIKGLEKLRLDFTGADEKLAASIKSALPDCVIEVYEVNGETTVY